MLTVAAIQTRFVLLLTASVLITSCTGMVKSMSELAQLHRGISSKFGEGQSNVNVRQDNNNVLVITFINSTLNQRSTAERAARAQETALFVKEHYPQIGRIDQIWVGFIKQETKYVIVTRTDGLEFFAFDRNAEALRPDQLSDSELVARASYIKNSDSTEIAISRLELDQNQGVYLVPHFTVHGNANMTKAAPPEQVGFDFAAVSSSELFPGETSIRIFIDDKLAFKARGTFNGAKSDDGVYSRFLYLKLSYDQFRRVTESDSVSIWLGDKNYRLGSEHVEAMRSMREYVKE